MGALSTPIPNFFLRGVVLTVFSQARVANPLGKINPIIEHVENGSFLGFKHSATTGTDNVSIIFLDTSMNAIGIVALKQNLFRHCAYLLVLV